MKIQNSVIFVKKNLKIDMLKIKSIVKLETNVIVQVNIEVLDIPYLILNIKYLNKLPQFFTGSNHNYFLS